MQFFTRLAGWLCKTAPCPVGARRRRKSTKLLMRLKIVFLLMVLGGAQLTAKTYGQQFNLKLTGEPLEAALEQIRTQSDYIFWYNKSIIKNSRPVSINVANGSIDDVLRALFSDQPLSFTIRDKTIVIKEKPSSAAQRDSISGTVTDSLSGFPLEGVTVLVKATNKAVATGAEGNFRVSAVQGDTLLFTYLGYASKAISVSYSRPLQVRLQPAAEQRLDEVVILGFGQTQRRIAQTGSTASITTKELKQSPTANITNALAGRLPGLISLQRSGEPGNDASQLFIRGRASLNSVSPLVTIDGVQKDYSAISLLDVNEIESVTILKDASATALYGVKGANGVIIVTTKRGAIGKPRINFSMESALQNPVQVPEFLNSYEFAQLANEAYLNDNPTGTPLYDDAALEHYRLGDRPLIYPDVDWMESIMKPGLQHRANFNISGGGEIARYFVNVGYLDQGGVYRAEKNDVYDPNANFKRYNFRSNVDINFDDNFTVGLSLYGAIEDKRNPNYTDADIFWTLIQVPPNYGPIKWPNGYYSKGNDVQNPFWLLNESGYSQSFNSSLSGMLSAERKLDVITPGLSVKGNYSFDGYFRNSLTRWARTLQAKYNSGYFEDASSYTFFNDELPLQAPSSSYTQNRDVWMDLSLNYNRAFGGHDVTGLLLANRTHRVLGNQVPYVLQGLVGRLVYNYKNRYLAEINGAYNGTDNFAKHNRYGFFPAFSVGYVLSEEEFLKNSPTVNFLKLRASYGLVGNDQLAGRRWPFVSEYGASAGYVFGETLSNAIGGTSEGAMANPDVRWEIAEKTNIGVELGLWNDLIGLKADVFYENRRDILISRNTVPGIIGASAGQLPTVNWGKVENKGFEIELNHRKRFGAINYFVNSNFSFARNQVLFMDEADVAYPWQRMTGRTIGQLYGLTAIGFFQSQEEIDQGPTQFGNVIPGDIKYADLNKDGLIDHNDEGAIGTSNTPEIFYGIAGGLGWRNVDFSVLFQGSANSSRHVEGPAIWEFFQGGKVADLHRGRWTPETAATATYPALHYGASANNFRTSSFFVDNTSYLRLKNVELGYTFREGLVTRQLGLSSIRVYSNAVNLFTWSSARLFDPENYSGYGAVYPPTRVFNFGISVSF